MIATKIKVTTSISKTLSTTALRIKTITKEHQQNQSQHQFFFQIEQLQQP